MEFALSSEITSMTEAVCLLNTEEQNWNSTTIRRLEHPLSLLLLSVR